MEMLPHGYWPGSAWSFQLEPGCSCYTRMGVTLHSRVAAQQCSMLGWSCSFGCERVPAALAAASTAVAAAEKAAAALSIAHLLTLARWSSQPAANSAQPITCTDARLHVLACAQVHPLQAAGADMECTGQGVGPGVF